MVNAASVQLSLAHLFAIGNSIVLLGPVFRAELVRTPRRSRYYTLRVIYGLVLIFLLWANYQNLLSIAERRGGDPLITDYSDFALTTFTWFASVQLATILMLIPALFGGVIADEKQRKTMHYLMASRLSSGEIVLDKLARGCCTSVRSSCLVCRS